MYFYSFHKLVVLKRIDLYFKKCTIFIRGSSFWHFCCLELSVNKSLEYLHFPSSTRGEILCIVYSFFFFSIIGYPFSTAYRLISCWCFRSSSYCNSDCCFPFVIVQFLLSYFVYGIAFTIYYIVKTFPPNILLSLSYFLWTVWCSNIYFPCSVHSCFRFSPIVSSQKMPLQHVYLMFIV
jgi:hypothetical protein